MPLGQARPQVELAGAEKLGNAVRWVTVSPGYHEAMRRRMKSVLSGLSHEMPKEAIGTGDRPSRAPWRDVCFDGNFILAGRKRLPVRAVPRGDWIFDAEELRKAILVHIPKENLVTPGQLQMRMAGKLIWLIAAIVVVVMVWALVSMNIIPGKP